MVVVPSISLPPAELSCIKGVRHYEERLMFLLLALDHPDVHLIYVSSLPVDPAIVDYYLGFLRDPRDAAGRLHMISADTPGPDTPGPPSQSQSQSLSQALLDRPDLIHRVRALLAETRTAPGAPGIHESPAWMVPWISTDLEAELARLWNLPIYGPSAAHAARFGSKSGSREAGRQAGVPMPRGFADLHSLAEVEHAARALSGRRMIVKLNDGYSGLGNAIVTRSGHSLADSPTSFSAARETWDKFAKKICERGAVLEEYIEQDLVSFPSALVQITPNGRAEVIATHDQVLGGVNADLYQGCNFPSRGEYRAEVNGCALRIGRVLAGKGVIGLFGIDFFVVKTDGGYRALLCEINLRIGGTTHPFGAMLLTTGARFDPVLGAVAADGRPKYYTATDNCASPSLRGSTPGEVVRRVEELGLGFDRRSRTGNVLHLLGSVPEHGKLGFTSIADSPEEAMALHRKTHLALGSAL
ncbi:hypothetical protein SAMN05421505_106233 [Sinosporangium album]|uniref:ATP-grasp domain-containing protein n=2 Tax=Sinosporangium album TaxID=504805 RepID=A0A1G7W7E7_9ACTN|nr:hypothetical protein SAMN05421505_106233 [Sinosporangium album]